LFIIAAATKVNVFPRTFSSATSTSVIFASQTYLLMMNHMAQTWYTRSLDLGMPAIQYF
jgi:hypothetical protein